MPLLLEGDLDKVDLPRDEVFGICWRRFGGFEVLFEEGVAADLKEIDAFGLRMLKNPRKQILHIGIAILHYPPFGFQDRLSVAEILWHFEEGLALFLMSRIQHFVVAEGELPVQHEVEEHPQWPHVHFAAIVLLEQDLWCQIFEGAEFILAQFGERPCEAIIG